jgi:hypothetical protein
MVEAGIAVRRDDADLAAQHPQVRRRRAAGTRYGRVLIGTDDLPLLPARMFPAKPELVLDRRLALAVG